MRKNKLHNLTLLIISLLLCLLVVEATLRFFVHPSPNSYGILFVRELPPIRIIPSTPPSRFERSEPYNNLVVEGRRITIGDLWGIHREDPLLGYAPKEKASSLNAWWQSNNIGARRRSDTPKEKPDNKKRILVFGESFANCSRVPQEQTWPAILESATESVDVINLGVDGYSMGQSLLRYRQMKNILDQ